MNNCWSNEDPRHVVKKRLSIVIVRPYGLVGSGFVNVEESYSIKTSFEDHVNVDVWDELWLWTPMPSVEKNG